MLAGTGSTLAWLSVARVGAQSPMLKNMGGEPPGFGHRSRAGGFNILEHCHDLGLGAVRMNLPSTDPEAVRQLRKKLESYGMRVIISLAPPKEAGALPQYEAGVRAVSELGAVTTHASFTARRYEEFDTFEAFKASFERHQRSVELAEPVLRKYKMKLAIENHKG
jgi:sugar phosphate isomerase/epimerase